ncbi:GAF domain-containing protein [Pedobacter nyackensis]|uniref:GAF domain-containing protein n=1 Tax=Pedobacter nyackensis TaxID=475255 RepID=UPI00292CC7C2|nr:GAF domain-containing protein [Pedobacter nyackensis]
MEKRIRKSISLVEKSRLENLKGYQILCTKTSRFFDELSAFTASLFNTQIAVINFVDHHHFWTKKALSSKRLSNLQLETSVCSLAIANEIADAFEGLSVAPSLITNALIAAEFGMRFYAATPIVTDEGIRIGSVCIIDKVKREFLPQEKEKLEWVAEMVNREMNKKRAQRAFA